MRRHEHAVDHLRISSNALWTLQERIAGYMAKHGSDEVDNSIEVVALAGGALLRL